MSTNTLVVKEPGRSYILETSDQLNAALYARQTLESREAAAASEKAAAASEAASQESEDTTRELQTAAQANQEASAASQAAAAQSETLANQHRQAASDSQASAYGSQLRARQWASETSGQELEPGLFSARHYAEQARADVSSAMVYRGAWDPTSGAFPDDDHTGSLYKVNVEGTLNGETYRVGDQIVYNGVSWDHIDNTETVTSVGGNVGGVTDEQLLAAVNRVGGAGSGLDADKLDGRDSTDFASAAQGARADSATQPGDLAAVATSGAYTDLSGVPVNATTSIPGLMSTADKGKLDGIEAGATGDQTDAEILAAITRVGGAGSGLDADLLDGRDATSFANASHRHLWADIDAKPATALRWPTFAEVTDKPTTYPPAPHTHDYLPSGGKAVDSDKLDGLHAEDLQTRATEDAITFAIALG